MTDNPIRRPIRLREYDYSLCGAYFVSICTLGRRNIFWEYPDKVVARAQDVILSAAGRTADDAVNAIPAHYPAVSVDKYVIMPNHIHLILVINSGDDGRPMTAVTVSTVVQQLKGYITKQLGFPVWQRSFYDHIIRSENDYREIWNYIDSNAVRWREDRFCHAE